MKKLNIMSSALKACVTLGLYSESEMNFFALKKRLFY